VYRLVWRNLIIFGHNFVVFILVAFVFGIWPGESGLLVLPGLLLIALNVMWIALLLGIICSRFRDVPLIVASIVQVIFFLTPILWQPSLLGQHPGFVDMNPFYHLIELVRMPLLGHSPPLASWMTALVIGAIGWFGTFMLFSRFRKRITYWL
jgi:ABC-type polysaccharide/polyol phosphate export permease